MTAIATPFLPRQMPSAGRAEVVDIEAGDRETWERYLETHNGQTLFHRWAWSDVLAVYGLTVLRLAVIREGRITGILPLVHQRSPLFGNRIVSLPWFDAAGIVADTADDRWALTEAVGRKAEAMGGADIELRQCDPASLSAYVRTDKVLLRRSLDSEPERLWDSLRPKVRNQIRKGQRAGLSFASGGPELLPEFFAVYSKNMRDLGSPSHALTVFEATCAAFPDAAQVHIVRLEHRTVGAALTLTDGEFVEVPWASSLRECNGLCINHVLYWNLLKDAAECGRRFFHFGRSSYGSGTYHFKKQWGAEDVPLFWYHLGRTAAKSVSCGPQVSFAWATAIWKRLPVCAASRLGPYVIARVS